jgi:D-glycero-D-manno-heptose 1,7-bisphosphate phosphatase
MRLAVHAPSIAAGSRIERAAAGLAARGHALLAVGGAPGPLSPLAALEAAGAADDVDVVLGGPRALAAAWWAARLRARALLLALEPDTHRRWGPLERWAWGVMGSHGVVEEADAGYFLEHVAEAERERLALWPAGDQVLEAHGPGGAAPEPVTHPDTTVLERACERALARRAAGPGRAALFVDRDGTVIEQRHYLSDPEDVVLLPGTGEALRAVRANGHPVVVISNQAGVGRGLFPESSVHAAMARLRRLLRAEGVELDAVRHCPHAPEAGCDCRKPGGRLLREAADDLRISLRDSVMVGDKWIDVDAGRAAGATGVLVRTGYGAEEERADASRASGERIADDLASAARWFLARAD